MANTMSSGIISDANRFVETLTELCEKNANKELTFEEEIHIVLVSHKVPLHKLVCGNLPALIVGGKLPSHDESSNLDTEEDLSANEVPRCDDGHTEEENFANPQPLTLTKARQLLSWYTMGQNPSMPTVQRPPLVPLWVRCDMSDLLRTTWLGAEPLATGNKVCGIKLYTVCSKGATEDKSSFLTLEELMLLHQKRHHASAVETKGYAQYDLFGSTIVENTLIESQCSIRAVLRWNNVEKLLQVPPWYAQAVLDIKLAIGDMKSPLYETYQELEFLEILAKSLCTGEAEWPETSDQRSALDLTKALIEELESIGNTGRGQTAKAQEQGQEEGDSDILSSDRCINFFSTVRLDRGDLDFTEQLWVKMRTSVTSYQDIIDCLKEVISAVRQGRIKPWVHRNNSNSLGRLILQSYKQQMEEVSLSGLTPVHMLLEMGLDKMRKDYVNYLVGRELTTLNYLSYYLDSSMDLQEQVTRVKKLHHLLEILANCSSFLHLPYECLFPFIQSCLKYYKDNPYEEEHIFQIQIKPDMISNIYQKENPTAWGMEVCSGQGSREARTSFHLSGQPLVDHVIFPSDFNKTLDGEREASSFYSDLVTHSLINFL